MPVQSLPQKPKVVPYLDSIGTCPKCASENKEPSTAVFQDRLQQIDTFECRDCGLRGYVSTQITFSELNPVPDAPEPFALDDDSNVVSIEARMRRKVLGIDRLSGELAEAQSELDKMIASRQFVVEGGFDAA